MQSQNMDIRSFESACTNRFLTSAVFVPSVLPLLNIYIPEVFSLCVILGENAKPAGILHKKCHILGMMGRSLTRRQGVKVGTKRPKLPADV